MLFMRIHFAHTIDCDFRVCYTYNMMIFDGSQGLCNKRPNCVYLSTCCWIYVSVCVCVMFARYALCRYACNTDTEKERERCAPLKVDDCARQHSVNCCVHQTQTQNTRRAYGQTAADSGTCRECGNKASVECASAAHKPFAVCTRMIPRRTMI